MSKWIFITTRECFEINDERGVTVAESVIPEAVNLIAAAPEMLEACVEAWNAFENGKRKHHHDPLTGRCILGCQACAIEKLKSAIARAKGETP